MFIPRNDVKIYIAGKIITGVPKIIIKYLISIFSLDKNTRIKGIKIINIFSKINMDEKEINKTASNNLLNFSLLLLASKNSLIFLHADHKADEPRINLISTDSIGKENITSGYNNRWYAFLLDLSIVSCLVMVSIE